MWKPANLLGALIAVLSIASFAPSARGDSAASVVSEDALAEEVNDPVAHLTQFQVKDIYTPAEYGTSSQPNTFQLRPVFAFAPHLFTPLGQFLRPTIQVVTVPRGKGTSTTTALDDLQLLDLFKLPLPEAEKTGFRLGAGAYFVFPISTSQFAGKGQWQVGPAGAFALKLDRIKRGIVPAVHLFRLHIFPLEIGSPHRGPAHPEL